MEAVNSIISDLLGMIDDKKKLFDRIMDITLKQKKDIEENEANNIEELVKLKQTVIDNINNIDKSFSEKFSLLKKQLGVNKLEEIDVNRYPLMKNLKQKVEEIMSIAKSIAQIEESNKEKLIAVMNKTKSQMKQLNTGKKSIKAYEKPVYSNDGIYIDKKK